MYMLRFAARPASYLLWSHVPPSARSDSSLESDFARRPKYTPAATRATPAPAVMAPATRYVARGRSAATSVAAGGADATGAGSGGGPGGSGAGAGSAGRGAAPPRPRGSVTRLASRAPLSAAPAAPGL